MKYETPVEFSCSDRTVRLAWTDATLDGHPMPRAYGRTFERYAPTAFIPTRGTFSGEPFLDWACRLPIQPEQLVNVRRGSNDTLIQIDTNSFAKTGATASFWTRYDYPEITFDPPYNAPYDSKREFVTVNCRAKTYRISVGYDFTPDGAVTDGMIERGDGETPLDSSDDYAIAIKKVACGKPINPKTDVGIGGNPIRTKAPLPDDLGIDDVANPLTVLTTAAKLATAIPAGPTVSTARISLTQKSNEPPADKHQSIQVIEPKQDGTTRVHEIYSPAFTVDRVFVGMVQLKSKIHSSHAESRGVTVTQSLTLEAPTWTPGARVSFTSEMRTVPGKTEPAARLGGLTCGIGQPTEASQVHTAFTGKAWPLDCQHANGTKQGYYVEELRYFLVLHDNSQDLGNSTYVIDDVSIER